MLWACEVSLDWTRAQFLHSHNARGAFRLSSLFSTLSAFSQPFRVGRFLHPTPTLFSQEAD